MARSTVDPTVTQGRSAGRRVLIVGANETGVMALRLLLRSAEPLYQPAGGAPHVGLRSAAFLIPPLFQASSKVVLT